MTKYAESNYHRTAGGVVLDALGRILLLQRDVERDEGILREFRLPKGHIDPGETDEAAAMREVGEESGYWELEIISDLGTARSEFEFYGGRQVRDEHYFLMRLTSDERKGPKFDPGSEEALFVPCWFSPEEAEMKTTYPSEKDFVQRARRALQ
jgi:8-oxo-dGTP pyrophosphatase MutT (NUDIX family)